MKTLNPITYGLNLNILAFKIKIVRTFVFYTLFTVLIIYSY